jgi:short-subunit dehydrogenase
MGLRGLVEGAVVVTGAASGFGREFARRVSAAGHPVALFDRDAKGLEETQQLLGRRRSHAAVIDLCDDDAIGAAVLRARDAVGPIAHCIHSAGVLSFGRVEATPVAEFRRLMEVNYLGSVKVAQATLPHLREAARGGRSLLLLVASIGGLRAGPEVGAYSASKFAVVGMAQALRDELRGTGVDVRALCPPPGDTPMLRNQATLPPIYKATTTLSADTIVDRAIAAVREPGPLELMIDAQSKALIALGRMAPGLAEWVVGKVAG